MRTAATGVGDLGTLGDFWHWAFRNIETNNLRGIFAEWVVKQYLEIPNDDPRYEWDAYDLVYGNIRVEVKSSAYIQTWDQKGKLSAPKFTIGPSKDAWEGSTNTYLGPGRHNDVYVLAMWEAQDEVTADVLNLDQWGFYVVTTSVFDDRYPKQKTMQLSVVQKLTERVAGPDLKDSIDNLFA